jgi:hypothetical protein
MNDTIVIFGSYNKGPEFEEKQTKVDKLKQEGIDAHLFYLLELTGDDKLPEYNVDVLMITNISKGIENFNPTILAFHNGLTIRLRKKEFMIAIRTIRFKHPKLKLLIEHLNRPDKSYAFKDDPNFLTWCRQNFENDHQLYDIIWKPKT